ncbi:MAG: CARDB domain-containing protein [Flavobacteriales bacterium]
MLDPGGNSNYPSYCNGTLTVTSADANSYLKLSFSSFSTESSYDRLTVYDGTSTSSPNMGTYSGSMTVGDIYSSTKGGSITLNFYSDGSYSYSGFSITVTCLTSLPPVDLSITSNSVSNSNLVAGNSFYAYTTVKNTGINTSNSHSIGYYLSTDTILDLTDTLIGSVSVSSLSGGSTSAKSTSLTLPTNRNGNLYLLTIEDYLEQITEDIENNNKSWIALSISPSNIDLTTLNPIVTPSTNIATGGSISLSSTILNMGTTTSPTSNMAYYISTDSTFSNNDVYLGLTIGSSLAGTTLASRSQTISLPSNISAGTYYILFVADGTNKETESDETNNTKVYRITISNPFIDLAITNPISNPTSIAAGYSITLSASIKNQGNFSALASNVGFYLSTDTIYDGLDIFLNYSSGSTLSAGSSSTRSVYPTIPSNTATGNYYILFVADYSNQVIESNESNNTAHVAVQIAAPVKDLYPLNTSLSSSSVIAGSSFTANGSVKNDGNVSSGSFYMGYYLSTDSTYSVNDTYISSYYFSSVSANATSIGNSTSTIPLSTIPGNYYLIYFADYSNTITESNENNNKTYKPITVTAANIDLTIQSTPYLSTSSVSAGNNVSVSCYIYNNGNASVSYSFVGYYLSTDSTFSVNDTYLTSSLGYSLSAGSSSYRSATLTIPGQTAVGNYYILYYADYGAYNTESNENNNVKYKAITVTAPNIDLVVNTVYVSPSSINAGNTVTVDSYVYNMGTTTSSSSNVGYYLSANSTWDASDTYLGYGSAGNISSGNYYYSYSSVTIPSGTAAGNYYIIFFADYNNHESESNENNNYNYSAITVTAPSIDLVISSIYGPATATAGSTASISCNILNLESSSSSYSYVDYYLSTNTTFDLSDQFLGSSYGGTLGSGSSSYKSYSATIPNGIATGNYYILFIADAVNYVTESNEKNNVSSKSVYITGIDNSAHSVPYSGSDSIQVCEGTISDHALGSDYSNYADGYMIVKPTAGKFVRLTFTSFNIEACCDYLAVYDGESTYAPLIGYYTSNPGTVEANNSSGALTVQFVSDGSTTMSGFQATISCDSYSATSEIEKNSAIKVYPNPAHIETNIEWDETVHPQIINIIDATGKIVYSRNCANLNVHRQSINIEDLSAGVYQIQIQHEEGIYSTLMLKTN